MSSKENARPSAATLEQAAEKSAVSKIPQRDLTTDFSERREEKYRFVSDLLHVGSENGLTLRELVQLTGDDERIIRRRIQAERKAGKLILSDCKNGYFLPGGASDVQRFIRSMSGRSREIAAVSRAAEDALAKMDGQERVDGW